MKLVILKNFKDKNTAERYEAGTTKEFEDARAEELLADPRELVKQAEPEEKPATKKKPASKKAKK